MAPFVTETTTLYCRNRFTPEKLKETAALNGFTSDVLGCPFLVADEKPDYFISINGDVLQNVGIADQIASADALLVVTHVTLHLWTAGLAASIKQLGMGCTGRKTKSLVHKATVILTDQEKCDGCASCMEVCKTNAVKIVQGKAFRTGDCVSCGVCIGACPNGALGASHDYRLFAQGLAEAACGVMKRFPPEKVLFLNLLKDITWHCDCEDFSDIPVFPDIGLIAGKDPVACDTASADMLNSAPPIQGSKAHTPKVLSAKDRIKAMSGIDWRLQVDFGESKGLGSKNYIIEEI